MLNYDYSSVKIAKQLSNFTKGEEVGKYDLEKWRTDKANNAIASVVSLERFFVIRSNIKRFVDKWGIKAPTEADNPRWYTKLSELLTKREQSNSPELSKLQSPAQYEKNWYWTIPQYGGRVAVGVSGILGVSGNLSFEGHQIGAIAIASPIIETITSYAKSNWYDAKEKQWAEFTQDTKELLDNYHELLGILNTIRSSELGQLNKVLKKLKKTTKEFLNEYDSDNNGVISVLELKESKNKENLANDLNKDKKWSGGSKLKRIVELMKMLEEKINAYVQGESLEETSLDNKKQELAWIIIDSLTEYSDSGFNAEKKYNEKGKSNWNGKSNWIKYLESFTTKDFENEKQKINLLCPLIEVMIERLNKFDVKELLTNHKENEKLLNEFAKKVQIICEIKQKLRNEELSNILLSLENKNKEFLSHLEKKSDDITENETAIAIEEEEKNLDEIIKAIKKLEEKVVETCHEIFTNRNALEQEQTQENDQLIAQQEISLESNN